MKKAILTLALAAVASSSMSGFVYGPVLAHTNNSAPLAVRSDVAAKAGVSDKAVSAADVQMKAIEFIDAYNFTGLVKYCSEVIATNPDMPEAYYFRAVGNYQLQEELETVKADLDKSLELNPQYIDAFFGHAIVATDMSDFESAINDYSSVLALQPENLDALVARMELHDYLGDLKGLESDYTHWISIAPSEPNAYYGRAVVRAEMNEIANAIADLEQTSKLLVAAGADSKLKEVEALIARLKNGETIG
jgi:tetratricopeptide (TPR) repeat protein